MSQLSSTPNLETFAALPPAGPDVVVEQLPPPWATPMTGQNIICFAKDWDEDPTSNNHIMRLLSEGNRVLWLNSIATRKPDLRKGRDLKKILRKLVSFFRGPRRVSENLWVYTPIIAPFPHSGLAARFNTWFMRIMLAAVRQRLGMGPFQLWTFLPTAAPYVGKMGESLVVYYVTDEYSRFDHVDAEQVAEDDRSICRQADVVFATAQPLVDRRLPLNSQTHLSRHGVDYDLFSSALDEATQVPRDMAALPGPVLGFYGALRDWLDFDLIEYLAKRHPDWSIALIGKALVDMSRLRQFANVHLLGRKPHTELPACCKGMTVGLIPHKVNELTRHMNPIKLREYLSAGLPVVSVRLPEVEEYAEHCRIAGSYEEFESAVEEAIRTDSPQARRQRSRAMRHETWARRVAEIGAQVMRVQDERLAAMHGEAK